MGRRHKTAEDVDWSFSVGQRITERRELLGITQMELAKRAGVDRGQLSRWEMGHAEPTSHHLFRLARALSCSMDMFYGEIKRRNLVKF